MEISEKILSRIKPSEDEKKELIIKINEFIKKIKVKDARVLLGGSGAKDTWLRNANDADIYVLFDYKKFMSKSDKLSDMLEKELKKSFKCINRLHGSRDYFQIIQNGFTFEIIPILNVKDPRNALNITDVSPLHADFVVKESKKRKYLPDSIRLVKKFCKAQGIYGAESYINGFSGYMCELLTIYYGGFNDLMKAASKWKDQEIIDIKKIYKGKNVLMEMNKSKIQCPLILIDPVQPDRNAAAALSMKNYDIFRSKAKEFLKKPSEKFFSDKSFDLGSMKGHTAVEINVLEGKRDIVGCKIIKMMDFIKMHSEKEGFLIKDYGFYWDNGKKAYVYFKVLKDLDKIRTIKGPPIGLEKHVSDFKKKHKKNFVKSNVIYAEEKRKVTNARDFVKGLLKEEYIKERVKSVRLI